LGHVFFKYVNRQTDRRADYNTLHTYWGQTIAKAAWRSPVHSY